jgi:plastocyanin
MRRTTKRAGRFTIGCVRVDRLILPLLLSSAMLAAFVRAGEPSTQPSASGSISGRISAAAGELPETIIFLEPVDAAARFGVPSEAAMISQKGARFTPSLLVISVGQAVEFHNDEDRPIEHNVFSRSSSREFDLGLYPPPQVRRVVFDRPGAVRLYCSIHRYMEGVIYVCPTPLFAMVGADGNFTIDGVPPGTWRLRTWQRNARFNDADLPVTVEAGGRTTADIEMKRG